MMAEDVAAQIREASDMLADEALSFSRNELVGALGLFREVMCDATDEAAEATITSLERAIHDVDEVTAVLQQAQEKMQDMAASVGERVASQAVANIAASICTGEPKAARSRKKNIEYAPFPGVEDPTVKPLISTLKSITESRDTRELRQILPVDSMHVLMHKGQTRGFYAAGSLVDYQLNEGEIYCVLYLGVAPRYRSRGYGAEMLARIEDEARAAGIDVIAVIPTETSEKFYEHHGFRFIYEHPEEDGHEMRKRLT